MKPQPEWLANYFRGIEEYWRYEALFESERWAVVKKPGHSFWNGRGERRAYAPAEYLLIRKDERHIDGFKRATHEKRLHEGRATKRDLSAMREALAAAECSP